MSVSTGPITDPENRRRRAQLAANARSTPDYHITKLVESAPTLTAEQTEQLRGLLPAPSDGRDAA